MFRVSHFLITPVCHFHGQGAINNNHSTLSSVLKWHHQPPFNTQNLSSSWTTDIPSYTGHQGSFSFSRPANCCHSLIRVMRTLTPANCGPCAHSGASSKHRQGSPCILITADHCSSPHGIQSLETSSSLSSFEESEASLSGVIRSACSSEPGMLSLRVFMDLFNFLRKEEKRLSLKVSRDAFKSSTPATEMCFANFLKSTILD